MLSCRTDIRLATEKDNAYGRRGNLVSDDSQITDWDVPSSLQNALQGFRVDRSGGSLGLMSAAIHFGKAVKPYRSSVTSGQELGIFTFVTRYVRLYGSVPF